MAEIKIEKKKPVWPWIVALLLIAAIVYYVFFRNEETQGETKAPIENTTSADSTSVDSTSIDSTSN
ncbi:hypothetical protein ASE21_11750 [Flavobacterium sp. Root901]|uniref:hypothetical protein n=1 Tax=Flavobacterium sp. Root901 TaxID=1736605 RepID=UPI000710CEAF|nr:hypothetical protein [Flavobacterium sp. Root901]KRD10375.1 hypothetical protein ASE21_11750 [Flavobacterium sp. Root901]